MWKSHVLAGVIAAMVLGSTPLSAQFGRGSKVVMRRSLPPAVRLDARSFNVNASSQEAAGRQVAESFKEMFKAKVQNDERFIYNDTNPELRISIVLTRFYVEPKQIPFEKSSCTTHLGNVQGTFSVIESDGGRPVASDTIGWKLSANEESHILIADDGTGVPVKGPGHQFVTSEIRDNIEHVSLAKKLNPFSKDHPCRTPFSANEARDVLADIFLTEIIHLSTPYQTNVEVKVSGDKVFREAVEEMADKQQWAKARDLLEKMTVMPKPSDEAARLHLIGLAYEGLGYNKGGESVELSQKIKRGMSAAELTPIRADLKRVEDEAKAYFEKAAQTFRKAKDADDEDDYRAGERRAEESRRLYVRIQNYRDAKPEPTGPKTDAPLSMSEIVAMCQQGSSGLIIADRIESAKQLSATRDQIGQLNGCGDKQDAVYLALKKRWDAKK